jgi:lactate dehydrogenase-like 2-hydroxyacid dehydrogenase
MKHVLYVGFKIDEAERADLKNRGFEFTEVAINAPLRDEDEDILGSFTNLLKNCDGYILGGLPRAEAALLAWAKNLKVILFLGTGYATFIDVDYCTAHGIKVGYCPGANANAVAEFSVALLTAAIKDIVVFNNEVKRGIWVKRNTPDIFDKTIGFIGFGNIGVAMANILHFGFGCKIRYHATAPKPELDARFDTRMGSLREVLAGADVTVVCTSLTGETRHLINTETVAAMKDGAILMNVARAEVVDTEAVLAGLARGKIGKYVTDVYHQDPVSPETALAYVPRYLDDTRLVVSPHTSYMTDDSFKRMKDSTVDTMCRVLSGEQSSNIVN